MLRASWLSTIQPNIAFNEAPRYATPCARKEAAISRWPFISGINLRRRHAFRQAEDILFSLSADTDFRRRADFHEDIKNYAK